MAESEQGTGWHTHGGGPVAYRNDRCQHPATSREPVPVLVVPVGEAREPIARALWKFDGYIDKPPVDAVQELFLRRADAVLAALAPVSEGGRGDCPTEHDGDYGSAGHAGPCPPHTCGLATETGDVTADLAVVVGDKAAQGRHHNSDGSGT